MDHDEGVGQLLCDGSSLRAQQWGDITRWRNGGEASDELVKPRVFLELRCLPLQLLIGEGGVEVVVTRLPTARCQGRQRTTHNVAAPGITSGEGGVSWVCHSTEFLDEGR
jgi:hypothetical protein